METAELLTKQLPGMQVQSMTLVSGVTDTSDTTLDVDFTSTNHPTFLSYDILTSFNKSGCRSNTFSSFTKAKGGLVFPFS